LCPATAYTGDAVTLRLLADAIVLVHLAFVLFVVLGGLLVLRWRWVAWVHVPAAVWGVVVELEDRVCPLTPVENWLRARAGQAGYRGGFVEHYVLPGLYPASFTRTVQLALGLFVLVINGLVYARVIRRVKL
jgi:hypothetical protein